MKPNDIKRIAEAAKASGLSILERWLPGGKVDSSGEYNVLNPFRADTNLGNLKIKVATGIGKDFGDGPGFKDYVAVVAFAMQIDNQSEAAEALAEFLRIPTTGAVLPAPTSVPKTETKWRVITPVPEGTQPAPAHYKLGKADHLHVYVGDTGQLLGYVGRWDATKDRRKEFHPLTWCEGAAGRREWRWQSWLAPRPLYGLDLLAARGDAVVVMHEGELKTEAARVLMPDCVSICWANGAASVGMADFRPLAGRDVILWRDYDEPGIKAMQAAAKAAQKAGARSIRFVNLDLFAKHTVNPQGGQIIERLQALPAGWDAADALAEGWTPQALADLLAREDALLDSLVSDENDVVETGSSAEPVKPALTSKTAQRFGPYLYDADRGLFYVEQKDGEDVEQPICGPLLVTALARDSEGGGWAPVMEFIDRDGQQRREIIPYKQFVGQGFDGVKVVADMGLEIAPNAKALDRMRNYIVGAKPHRRGRLFDQTGWYERAFLLPDGAIGETDETLLFRGNRRMQSVYATKGKLTDWQTHIAHPAIGNPRLMFALATAFAGPLLKQLNLQGMAFHLCGDSSTGKSGAQHAAGSTWGSPEAQVHSWRTTDNAVEYTAAQHNHALLILDELREVDPKAAGAIVYMLTNARGKGRAHHAGGLREATTWCIVMLSSGELGLSDHLAGAGQKYFDGQEVRFIEIEADAGVGHGMWNDVGACAGGGKQFTDNLKKFAARYYGTAGRAFLKELVKNLDQLPTWWRYHVGEFENRYKPQDAGGQVLRVMSAFCLVAFAGELASKFEVVPWPRGAATAAAGGLFTEWASARPSRGNGEEIKMLGHVRGVMERNWQAKFLDWERASGTRRKDEDERERSGDFDPDLSRMPNVIDALGFRKADMPFDQDNPNYIFYVQRGRFIDEFAAKGGFKFKKVAAVLKKHGVLQCDVDGTTWRETLPNGDPRSYCIIGKKLWALEL
jgi:putative DNA primase/helicase